MLRREMGRQCRDQPNCGAVLILAMAAVSDNRDQSRMKTTSKTEIAVETHRILTITINRSSRYRVTWCEECGKPARMVSADEAAILASLSSRAIYQLIEARELHFLEASDGLVFICLNSLAM